MGLFDNTPLPQTPSPEPPGFDLLRDIIMRRIFQNQANPYGMSQGAMNNPSSLFSTGIMGGRLGGGSSNGMQATSGGGGGFGGGMQGGIQSQGSGGNIAQLLHMLQGTRPLMHPMGGGTSPPIGGMPPPGPQMPGGGGGARRFGIPQFDGRTLGYDAPIFPWMPGGQQTPPTQMPPPQQTGGGGGSSIGGGNQSPPYQPPGIGGSGMGGGISSGGGSGMSGNGSSPQYRPPTTPPSKYGPSPQYRPPAPQYGPPPSGGQVFSNQPRGKTAQYSNNPSQQRFPMPPSPAPSQFGQGGMTMPSPFQWNYPSFSPQNQNTQYPPSFPFLSPGYL